MFTEGIPSALSHVRILYVSGITQVYMNIMLFVPMGYLLPFIIKPMRYSIIACTAAGFICSVATEYAQLNYGLGYFQLDDIINNTLGCLIGAILGNGSVSKLLLSSS